ncbi:MULTISPECIES: GvpL/GvpF family gas vesicle protein [Micromonospora]|uniref:Gas vesicle protein GvpFL n=1 Tax=Micromonospora solifontis TaxID=2487138 RepID=A0ABX9WGI1_9ACTN|nr:MULTISPECIES: GvpL/GvpF family gas vesicle protein [Micromonospora]NES16733.1 GvpL/GvpF family gas vesicle protein [Micromonospora sp. PPF5-17B]NES37699.1 GvpL/GvpF family gas vesicle protein [Micromonospora solifontis]NES58437.1 GvpL/GvpF family gas vesicle protein [Micromonospora sp. PPF5-6]RNL98046.1 gas vesicle protein GvpFL [Micromonospora solifontis]
MAEENGLFIYGIVPADVEPTPDAEGVGNPPAEVTAIRHGELAALVSEVGLEEPMGRPADLTAYERLLDGTAEIAPVLPVRFGTVVTGADAVEDLLAAHQERFAAALAELEDRIQYTVHGRFDEQEFISGFLADNDAAAGLAEQIRGRSEAASREQRIRLGEMISQAVELRREAENRALVDAVGRYAVADAARQPSHELDAVNVAFLVGVDDEEKFIGAVEEFAEQRRELIRTRLIGPLAPYDFISAHQLVE